ncbi:Protein-tyrosine phosphatase [Cooperia oncophora]
MTYTNNTVSTSCTQHYTTTLTLAHTQPNPPVHPHALKLVSVCRKHEKCCFYLPKERREVGYFGDFKVTVKEIKPDPFDGIKHTVLDVKWEIHQDNKGVFSENELLSMFSSKSAIVHHLAYFNWPDHTAPLSAAPTIGMFKLSRTLANGAPITVHCSAGIGRSATFIAIDYASQKIREKPDASMVDVIRDLRCQRFQAIQSAIQYVFLHICLLELFAGEGALSRDTTFNDYLDSYVSNDKAIQQTSRTKGERT